MLNFDSSHQFINGDIKNKKGKKMFKNFVLAGLIATNVFVFSGCSKDVPCNIEEEHAHYYVNDDNLGRYIISEKNSVFGLSKSDDYIPVDGIEEILYLDFLNENELFRISDNQEIINAITSAHQDYIEYRYEYSYLIAVPAVIYSGGVAMTRFNYIPAIGYSWTTDTSKNLTGEERACHYVYYGYKVTKDEHGYYTLIKSEPVDDLQQLPEGYDYIKENFYDIVNLYNKSEVFDYEDGPEEDKEIISEEEYIESQNKTK
ncbi:MAG: hypothetical protein IJI22_04000 [Bacilli bacterium]|nr:hypothetical protein [Bacilli bacterium]